jgi:hypothetical protein
MPGDVIDTLVEPQDLRNRHVFILRRHGWSVSGPAN